MSNTDQLDTFETALLAELRREVAEHPAPAQALRRPPRRRLNVVAAGAVATAAATVLAVGLSGGGPTASPAFAVTADPDGSVNIVIHRLADADGLEGALAEHGLDATVHFVPVEDGNAPPEPEVDGSYVTYPSDAARSCGIDNGPGPAMLVPGWALNATDRGSSPRGQQYDDAEYVLQIPADSPLFQRPLILDVGSPGSISMAYPSSVPGKYCFFGQGPVMPGPGLGDVK